jgi:hypothetical protein
MVVGMSLCSSPTDSGKSVRAQTGLTIAELLVAMVVSAMTIGAAYALFRTHHRMALRQEESTLMQQELLAATTQIAEELRMCGYSPGSGSFGFRNRPDTGAPDYGRETSARGVYCTLDLQGDGNADESGSGSAADHIGYRLNVDNSGAPKNPPDSILRKYDTGAVKWQPLCTNIGEIRFVYRDRRGDVIEDPALRLADIRMIDLRVTAVPSENRRHLGIANRTMSTTVWCRNADTGG